MSRTSYRRATRSRVVLAALLAASVTVVSSTRPLTTVYAVSRQLGFSERRLLSPVRSNATSANFPAGILPALLSSASLALIGLIAESFDAPTTRPAGGDKVT